MFRKIFSKTGVFLGENLLGRFACKGLNVEYFTSEAAESRKPKPKSIQWHAFTIFPKVRSMNSRVQYYYSLC